MRLVAFTAALALALPAAARGAGGWSDPVALSPPGVGANAARVAIGPQDEGVVVWRATPPGGDPSTGKIQAAVRPKGAAAFGAATDLSQNGVLGAPAVAFSPLGDALAAWSLTQGHGFPYEVQTAVLASGGASFGDGPGEGAGSAPWVAFDGVGNSVLAWTQTVSGHTVVEAAARGPGNYAFDSPGQVSGGAANASSPAVVFDGNGNATIAWIANGSAVQVSTRAAGGGFSGPQTISAAGEGAIGSIAAAGGGGGAVIAWVRSDGALRAAVRSGGGGFAAPQTLAAGGATEADAARGADGTTAVAWSSGSGANLAISPVGGGGFGPPVALGAGSHPRVAVAPDGSVLAVWAGDGTTPRAAWTAPAGGALGAPVDLGPAEAQGASIGDVAIGADGSALAAWSAGIPPSAVVKAVTRAGVTPLPPDTEQPTQTGGGGGGGGGGAGGGGGSEPPVSRPSLSRFGLSAGAFTARRGTTIKWTLDRAVTTWFFVERPQGGKRVKGRCLPDTGRYPNKPACVIVKRIGAPFSVAGRSGFNTAKFRGYVGSRKLKPGVYRLAAYARDNQGRRSPTARAPFQILRG